MGSSRYPVSALGRMRAPDLDAFEALAHAAWESLPDEFRALCEGLQIKVTEFPDDDVVEAMDLDSPFDILGLFEGVGLAHAPAVPETGAEPNVIHLYRRPMLDYWAENDESLADIVSHVLIHEIGHHFGLSDDDMDAIEARA